MNTTNNRIIAVFTAFCIAIGTLCLRLYIICSKGNETVLSQLHGYTVNIQDIRGDIVDCHGERLVNDEYDNIAVLKPTVQSLSLLETLTKGDTLRGSESRIKKGNAIMLNIGTAVFEESNDAFIVKKYIRYSKRQPARHIIGYTDSENRGVTGIEKYFDDILYCDKKQKIRFCADAYGRIIRGGNTELLNFDTPTGCVQLTIDKAIQQEAENIMDRFEIGQGGMVVADVKTGAVRAMISRPDYDTYNLAECLDDESAPLLNRTLNSYTVGSVFKAVVAASAIEHGIDDFYYNCKGTCNVDGTVFGCNNHKAHGELNMQKALEVSCNTYFINLAKKLGGDALLETAEKTGLGERVALASDIYTASGQLPSRNSLENSGALANFSFGQGEFTANLMQMVQVFSAIANGGKYTIPYIVEKTVTADGKESKHQKRYPVVALSESTSIRVTKMLTSVVEKGNAKLARLENGIPAAGKTATAQTGTYGKNGVEIYNTWFCGFFPADKPKYVIVILKQGGSSGAEDCAPVFKAIADRIAVIEGMPQSKTR